MGRSKELFIWEREQLTSDNFIDDTYQALAFAESELNISVSINTNSNK